MFPKLQSVPAGNDGRDGRCCRCFALDHGRLARFLSPFLPRLERACLEDVLLAWTEDPAVPFHFWRGRAQLTGAEISGG